MEVEFDFNKAEANESKHGVSFEEAASALLDPMAVVIEDQDAEGENRWVLLGMSDQARLLVVVYALRDEDRIRIISARRANRTEQNRYA